MASWLVVALSVYVMAVFMASAFKDPYEWSKTFYSCTPDYTKHHSPIDFNGRVVRNETIPPLSFTGFHDMQSRWTVANIRDTVLVEVQEGMKVSGGWLENEYRIMEMRFHWGSRTTNGSEHTFNKRRFPMEIGDENVPFEALSNIIPSLGFPGNSVNVTPPALMDLMPNHTEKFYRYSGSQTTPPCLQTVQWIVFEEPIFISKQQYLVFATSLYYSNEDELKRKLLVENYRPVQSSAFRKVFASPHATVPRSRGASHAQVFNTLVVLLVPGMLRTA